MCHGSQEDDIAGNHYSKDDEAKRVQLRSQVVMPEIIEEPVIKVDGAKEYRRNALLMFVAGLFLIIAPAVVLFLTGHFFFVMPLLGLYLLALAVKRLGENTEN